MSKAFHLMVSMFSFSFFCFLLQGPEVDRLKGTIFEFQTRKRAKTEKSTAGGDSGYGGELTSHITANTIEVERLIVNHLTTDVIQAPNA